LWRFGGISEQLTARRLAEADRGVDLTNESRWKDGAVRSASIQQRFIKHLEQGPATFIIDDDEWYYKSHYEVQKSRSQPGKQIKNNVVILLDYLNSNGVNTKKFWINSIVALNNPNIIIEETPKHYDIVQPSEITKFITNTNKTLNRHTLKTIVNLLEPYSRFSNN